MGLVNRTTALFARIPYALIGFMGRLSVAWLIWSDGRARIGYGWDVWVPRAATMDMLRGGYDLKFVPFELAAVAVQLTEFVLPLLLAVGLATRFAALGLLVLIIVFEIFVHLGPYGLHGAWAALLLMIIKFGPGSLSLDEILGRR